MDNNWQVFIRAIIIVMKAGIHIVCSIYIAIHMMCAVI